MQLAIADTIVIPRVEVVGPSGISRADLLLDTGAALTTLSRAVVESAGYDVSGVTDFRSIVTGNGVIRAPVLRISELRIRELVVQSLLICVLDIPEAAHVEGLLGINFLKEFRTVIDYPERIPEHVVISVSVSRRTHPNS